MRKTVGDVMTSDPYAVSPEASAIEAARMMDGQNIGSLPVVEGERLVGIVTDRDLAVRVVATGPDPSTTTVGEIATANLHSATPDEALDGSRRRRRACAGSRSWMPTASSSGCSPRPTSSTSSSPSKAGQLVEEISHAG